MKGISKLEGVYYNKKYNTFFMTLTSASSNSIVY